MPLVNNAAGNVVSRTEDLSPRAVESVLPIVLHGTAHVTLACGRRWLAAAEEGAQAGQGVTLTAPQSLAGCANLQNPKAAVFDRKAAGAQLPWC